MALPVLSAPRPMAGHAVPARQWPATRILSVVTLALMAAASVCGLAIPGVYRDPTPVVAVLRGYDLITLVLVVPALAVTVLTPWRATRTGLLVWLSTLAYGVYTYAFNLFGTAFGPLFLVHVAVFGLCVYTLAIGLATLDVTDLAAAFRARTPVRLVAALLILLGGALAGMWIVNALRFAVTGVVPQESVLVLPSTHTHLGYVLDLALFAPAGVLAGVLLWRRRPWGYPLAAVVLLFGGVLQLCYLAALAFQAWSGVPGATGFDPAEPVILAVFVIDAVLLLAGLRPQRDRVSRRRADRSAR
jgi:hypothetical protein